jgi:hypothetical protein
VRRHVTVRLPQKASVRVQAPALRLDCHEVNAPLAHLRKPRSDVASAGRSLTVVLDDQVVHPREHPTCTGSTAIKWRKQRPAGHRASFVKSMDTRRSSVVSTSTAGCCLVAPHRPNKQQVPEAVGSRVAGGDVERWGSATESSPERRRRRGTSLVQLADAWCKWSGDVRHFAAVARGARYSSRALAGGGPNAPPRQAAAFLRLAPRSPTPRGGSRRARRIDGRSTSEPGSLVSRSG